MRVSEAPDRVPPRWQRSLLPAMLGADHADRGAAGGELPRSARDWLIDIVMFGGALGVGSLVVVQAARRHQLGTTLLAIDIVLGVLACLALWVRRRHPLAVGVGLACVSALSSMSYAAAVAALFTVAVYRVPRRTAQATLLSVAANVVFPLLYRHPHHHHYAVESLLLRTGLDVLAVGCGTFVRARRQLVLSLHGRARRLQEEQHARVREARRAERARMAREMHDVLAHRISLLSLHAGALEFRPDAPPEEIARTAGVIRISARAAQEELREVIGVLRADSEEEEVQPPQPTIADVSMLVQECRRAGMEVRFDPGLQACTLPPTLGRTVYRLVQEGLTNARRHAPGQLVVIELAGDARAGISVAVVNRPAVGRAAVTVAPEDQVGSGTGLIGLGERVALVGGRLTCERLGDGGFALRAALPWSGGSERPGASDAMARRGTEA